MASRRARRERAANRTAQRTAQRTAAVDEQLADAPPLFAAVARRHGFVPEPPAVPGALTDPTVLLPTVQPRSLLGLLATYLDEEKVA